MRANYYTNLCPYKWNDITQSNTDSEINYQRERERGKEVYFSDTIIDLSQARDKSGKNSLLTIIVTTTVTNKNIH